MTEKEGSALQTVAGPAVIGLLADVTAACVVAVGEGREAFEKPACCGMLVSVRGALVGSVPVLKSVIPFARFLVLSQLTGRMASIQDNTN